MRKRVPAIERINAHFEPKGQDECWPWLGALDSKGYGRMVDDNQRVTAATRVMVRKATGVPVPADRQVLHTCDNPPCINPSHLVVGTPAANTLDMHRKGRGRAKLNATIVAEMRQANAAGETQASIAARYGVREACVQRLVARRTWKWVA